MLIREEKISEDLAASISQWRHSGFNIHNDNENCTDPDFIVADVLTNLNGRQILHLGVGEINVIYFTAETCAGPTIYVGPVFSYYERVEDYMKRLNDNEWYELISMNSANIFFK